MSIQTQEARIILAIEAIRTSKKLSRRKAAKLYNIPLSTLCDRMNGRTAITEQLLPATKLTKLKEEVLIQYII